MTDYPVALPAGLGPLLRERPGRWNISACGVTRQAQSIPALLDRDAYRYGTHRVRILLISGLSQRAEDVDLDLNCIQRLSEGRWPEQVALSAVPCLNVDAFGTRPASATGLPRDLSAGYPPEGNFYYDADAPEKRYIWRWVCFQAPDLVLEVRWGEAAHWEANAAAGVWSRRLEAATVTDDDSLLAALDRQQPDGTGPIPGLRLTARKDDLPVELDRLWQGLASARVETPSAARGELYDRRSRPISDVAGTLASVYGHKLDPVVYMQGVAISGRLRLARLSSGVARSPGDAAAAVASVVGPYLSGEKDPFGEQPGGSTLGGVVWAYDLAQQPGGQSAHDLLLRAASFIQPRGPGEAPAPADPDFRVEDLFNISAILGRAFRLSGDSRYLDLMKNFLLESGVQQANGLFWHCRSAPYFWGRGNGFAALGFAEALTYLPEEDPDRGAILQMHRQHLEALRQLQQPSGMWWQLLDVPGSYQEFTCTCMIGYAMARGLRRGWLDSSYRDAVELAWRGVSERTDNQGNVVDACISTGVQQSIKEYLDRPAVSGQDDRSGAMALWFAVEMERLRRGL